MTLAIDRASLLTTKNKNVFPRGDLAFVSGFHRQLRQVEHILKKRWLILLKDRDLKDTLPQKPKFIYRRAPGLRNMIASNVPDPPKKLGTFLE